MTRNHILLLTATVTPPPGVPALKRTDPTTRLRDYAEALNFYIPLIGQTFHAIVFVENSTSDIRVLKALVSKWGADDKVEFISFDGLNYPSAYGRGYGEFKLVDYAMRTSTKIISGTYIWKCTGRYIIENIAALVTNRPDADVYCHARDFPYKLCELFLMSFTVQGFERVIEGRYPQLRNDLIAGIHSNEEISFRKLLENVDPSVSVRCRFTNIPIVRGVRGWNNLEYSGKWSTKTMVRRAMNVVAPRIWL